MAKRPTAPNAHAIALNIGDAMKLLREAEGKLRAAVELIEKNENEPELKVPQLKSSLGALDLVGSSLSPTASDWVTYGRARERSIG